MEGCKKCGGIVDGFMCELCGEEFAEFDKKHECGSALCKPRCAACGHPETKCTCTSIRLTKVTEKGKKKSVPSIVKYTKHKKRGKK